MTPDEFIELIGNAAGKVCADYNLPASVCIAQAALESGWGKYCIGNYNYFGRKYNGWGDYVVKPAYILFPQVASKYNGWGDYVVKPAREYINGEWTTIYAKFQSYDSLEDAVYDWCVLMAEEPAYRSALQVWHNTWEIGEFVRALAPVYATDPDYASKVLSTINANDLMRFDGWND